MDPFCARMLDNLRCRELLFSVGLAVPAFTKKWTRDGLGHVKT